MNGKSDDLVHFSNDELKNLDIFFLMLIATDVIATVSFFIELGGFLKFLSVMLLITITSLIILLYRIKPDGNFNTKIIFSISLYTFFVIILILITNSFSLPKLVYQLTLDSFNNNEQYINNMIINNFLSIINGVIWVLFGYFFTTWFNKNFSQKLRKIRLFFFVTCLELIAEFIVFIGSFGISLIFNNINSAGLITPDNLNKYQSALTFQEFGVLLLIFGNFIEIFAFYKMYKRLQNIRNGRVSNQYSAQLYQNSSYLGPNYTTNSLEMNQSQIDREGYCSNCGATMEMNATFCGYCGSRKP